MGRVLRFVAVALAVSFAWVLLLPVAPVAQPIPFAHAKHAAVGCAVCHRGVERAARAELPPPALCAKCHATSPRAVEASAWEAMRVGAVPWRRVTRIPDHVLFSHRRHVALANLDCASCHADIGARAEPPRRAPVRLDMDGCLSCHKREGASEDCAACHR